MREDENVIKSVFPKLPELMRAGWWCERMRKEERRVGREKAGGE